MFEILIYDLEKYIYENKIVRMVIIFIEYRGEYLNLVDLLMLYLDGFLNEWCFY